MFHSFVDTSSSGLVGTISVKVNVVKTRAGLYEEDISGLGLPSARRHLLPSLSYL